MKAAGLAGFGAAGLVMAGLVAVWLPAALRAAAPAEVPFSNDYPSRALREGHDGTAYFTVEVSEAGRAENCVITQSSGWADLDEATCRLVVVRARFDPPVDVAGRPTRGSYANKVVWKIPR